MSKSSSVGGHSLIIIYKLSPDKETSVGLYHPKSQSQEFRESSAGPVFAHGAMVSQGELLELWRRRGACLSNVLFSSILEETAL